jgi:hypothetical protein
MPVGRGFTNNHKKSPAGAGNFVCKQEFYAIDLTDVIDLGEARKLLVFCVIGSLQAFGVDFIH